MMKLISPAKADAIIAGFDGWIREVSGRYGVPAALVKAVLYQEMTNIDALDPVADAAVMIAPRHSRDSSTGYAQIFGRTGLIAANFALDHGLTTYELLGLESDHRLDPANRRDVFKVWRRLHEDAQANIEFEALVLLCAADEVIGRIDFATFSDDELKLVLSRYNADVRQVTSYGEQAFAHYERFKEQDSPTTEEPHDHEQA